MSSVKIQFTFIFSPFNRDISSKTSNIQVFLGDFNGSGWLLDCSIQQSFFSEAHLWLMLKAETKESNPVLSVWGLSDII